ncbi:RNA-binding protein [Aliibacillus thermotolerans]|uniref:RNA-binding protein n=1 Tax=Aliibacillus thermotolerans TaxID=1834418 RepID=A0ABW0U1Y2_9BACI|nr:RNA-binding protein [Aliibacillus thermotolerans]MDA3130989.1 RNA-binding protein [Aliibacillus thermotolerans]
MTILDHFRKEEHPFVEQALEWKEGVETRYERKLTEFLDPREQAILSSIVGKDETVFLSFWGGQANSERKRAILYPFYEEVTEEDFELVLFEIIYPNKFITLSHRDCLGALLNIGLVRQKFGDIIEGEGCFQFLTTKEVSMFVQTNLEKVGQASVTLKEKPLHHLLPMKEEWKEKTGFVSSLRLDALLSEMYHLSRNKVLPYIEKKRVKVNWQLMDDPSYPLEAGDYLSVRGLGRRKLFAIDGETKKGRLRIRYGEMLET